MTLPVTASRQETRRSLLGERLRCETRDAHAAAEAAFDLSARLVSLESYADGLLALESFHRACAPALATVRGHVPPALRDGPERRHARLTADLERLGREPRSQPMPGPRPASRRAEDAEPLSTAIAPDAGLGAWYVLEGAALGGLLIASEVARRLPAALPASTFFAGEGKATAARWRAFQDVLRGWETRGAQAADQVVAGATATFEALIEQFGVGA